MKRHRTFGCLVLVVSTAACGPRIVSQTALDEMEQDVSLRNKVAYERAIASLAKRGLHPVVSNEPARVLSTTAQSDEVCLHASGPKDAPLEIRLSSLGGDAQAKEEPVTAPREKACAFLWGSTKELQITFANGQSETFSRPESGTLSFVDAKGSVVRFALKHNVTSRKKVLIERSCNLMPSPPLNPFEHHLVRVYVVRGPVPKDAPTETLSVDHEELDVACTQNSY